MKPTATTPPTPPIVAVGFLPSPPTIPPGKRNWPRHSPRPHAAASFSPSHFSKNTPERLQKLIYDFGDVFIMRDSDRVIPIQQCAEEIPNLEDFSSEELVESWKEAVRGFVAANHDGIWDNLADGELTVAQAREEIETYREYLFVKP